MNLIDHNKQTTATIEQSITVKVVNGTSPQVAFSAEINYAPPQKPRLDLLNAIMRQPTGDKFVRNSSFKLCKELLEMFEERNPQVVLPVNVEIGIFKHFWSSSFSMKLTVGAFTYKTYQMTPGCGALTLSGIFNAAKHITLGEVVYASRDQLKGTFDPETERLISGKRTFDNGNVHEGTFDPTTGRLIKGRKTFADSSVAAGTFDPKTGNLTKGKKTFANGKTHEGTFDPKTEQLQKGKKTSCNGKTQEGTFDPETGNLTEGKKIFTHHQEELIGDFDSTKESNLTEVLKAAQEAVEKADALVKALREKYHFSAPIEASAATASEA